MLLDPNPLALGIFLAKKSIHSFKYLVQKHWLTVVFLFSTLVSQSQPDLEGDVPLAYSAAKGTLSISDRHYRLGQESLRWDWTGGDTLFINLTAEQKNSINPYLFVWGKNHFEMWVHNESASKDTFEVKFI